VRVYGTGGRPAVPGRPGNWLIWLGVVGEAPSISYMEGALLYCARQTDLAKTDTPRGSKLTITARASASCCTSPIKVRKDIDALSARELTGLRRAIN
jgi:hypothetical protein